MAEDQQDSYTLTPEEEELVREGLESEKTGITYTPEEVREMARKRTKAWMEAVQDDRLS